MGKNGEIMGNDGTMMGRDETIIFCSRPKKIG
jgi:hypothetical protein